MDFLQMIADFSNAKGPSGFEDEVLNALYGSTIKILAHNKNMFLVSDFCQCSKPHTGIFTNANVLGEI